MFGFFLLERQLHGKGCAKKLKKTSPKLGFCVQLFPENVSINLIGYSRNFHVAYLFKREIRECFNL
jgi:hypothetical protein